MAGDGQRKTLKPSYSHTWEDNAEANVVRISRVGVNIDELSFTWCHDGGKSAWHGHALVINDNSRPCTHHQDCYTAPGKAVHRDGSIVRVVEYGEYAADSTWIMSKI